MPQTTTPPTETTRAVEAPLTAVLERYWGYRDFRPLQREAAEAILKGRDSLVVLPTGGGKSLCYQAPALTRSDGVAVVVSPLISLMKDQVDSLTAAGVPAAYYNSSLTPQQQSRVASRMRQGRYRLVYVSPERLMGEAGARFQELLRDCGLTYLAVDEAHCISHWGHDFRPEYRQLGRLRDAFPDISLHAYTATATVRVREDIQRQLGLRAPEVLVGGFDRPNLVYRVVQRRGAYGQVRAVLDRHPGEAGIVYCLSRRQVDSLAERLAADGFRVLPYHAGLAGDERQRHQEAFLNEQVDVVVATVAFGMGIDRSNVRFVVHAGVPRSIEHYQQEAGRAGRDGLEAECLLLWSAGDFSTWRRMLHKSGELTEQAARHLAETERFAKQAGCRHRALTEHFGQTYDKPSCGACDWCLGELEMAEEPVVLAQKILSCVLRLKQSWGVRQVIDVLRGRTTKKVTTYRHQELSTFGLLAECPKPELRAYVEQLVDQGFLRQEGAPRPLLKVTAEGRRLLKAEVPCELYRSRRDPSRERPAGMPDAWQGVDRGLFEELCRVRLEIARQRDLPPYAVFHDTTLRHLARQRPSGPRELLEVSGVGQGKAAQFGSRLLEALDRYCAEHRLERDVPPKPEPEEVRVPRWEQMSLDEALELAAGLFAQGAPVAEVAPAIDRARSTTLGYLVDWIREQQPDSVDPWVEPDVLERIRRVYDDPTRQTHQLKDYFEHFEGEIGYDQLRVAVAFLEGSVELSAS